MLAESVCKDGQRTNLANEQRAQPSKAVATPLPALGEGLMSAFPSLWACRPPWDGRCRPGMGDILPET